MPFSNPDKQKEYHKQYYLLNKIRDAEKRTKYRVDHNEEKKQIDKIYRDNHKEETKQYRIDNHEHIAKIKKSYDSKYRVANRKKRNKYDAECMVKTIINGVSYNYRLDYEKTGFCLLCNDSVIENTCTRTSAHHLSYDMQNLGKHTIELCNSCHKSLHHRLKLNNKKIKIIPCQN